MSTRPGAGPAPPMPAPPATPSQLQLPRRVDFDALRRHLVAFPGFQFLGGGSGDAGVPVEGRESSSAVAAAVSRAVSAAAGGVALFERSLDLRAALGRLASQENRDRGAAAAAYEASGAESARVEGLLEEVVAAVPPPSLPPPVGGGLRASFVESASGPPLPSGGNITASTEFAGPDKNGPAVAVVIRRPRYHAVRVGRSVRSCIFLRWGDAETHVLDFDGAEYGSFDDVNETVVFALSDAGGEENNREGRGADRAVLDGGKGGACQVDKEVDEGSDAPEEIPENEELNCNDEEGDFGAGLDDYVDLAGIPEGNAEAEVEEEERNLRKGRAGSGTQSSTTGAREGKQLVRVTERKKEKRSSSKLKNSGEGENGTTRVHPPLDASSHKEHEKSFSQDEDDSDDEGEIVIRFGDDMDLAGLSESDTDAEELEQQLRRGRESNRGPTDTESQRKRRVATSSARKWKLSPSKPNIIVEEAADTTRVYPPSEDEEEEAGEDTSNDSPTKKRKRTKTRGSGCSRGRPPQTEFTPEWTEKYDRLLAIYMEKGTIVPLSGGDEIADLRKWLSAQKQRIRRALEKLNDGDGDGDGDGNGNEALPPLLLGKKQLLEELGVRFSYGRGDGDRTEPDPKWMEMYERARAAYEETGSVLPDVIDRDDEDAMKLRRWVGAQKFAIRRNLARLEASEQEGDRKDPPPSMREKIRLLEEVDVDPTKNERTERSAIADEKSVIMLERLRAYKERTGSFKIPSDDEENADLLKWLYRTTTELRKSLSVTAAPALASASAVDGTFQSEDIVTYINRRTGKRSRSLCQKARLLEEMGYDMSEIAEGKESRWQRTVPVPTKKWLDMLERLRLHKERTGTFEMRLNTADSEENADLRQWLATQVSMLRLGRMPDGTYVDKRSRRPNKGLEERARRLEAIGFVLPEGNRARGKRRFTTPEWREMYAKLRAYRDETGTIHVDKKDERYAPLRKWKYQQMEIIWNEIKASKERSGGQLHPAVEEKVRLFEELGENARLGGYESVVHPTRFDEMLERYTQYKAEHDGTEPPRRSDDPTTDEIFRWAMWQRHEYEKMKEGGESKLTAERMQRLVMAGFEFSFKKRGDNTTWEERLEQFRAFGEENSHMNVPVDHPVLGLVVKQKRRQYRLMMSGLKKTGDDLRKKFKDLEELGVNLETRKSLKPRAEPKSWEGRFEELRQYRELHGHCVVSKYEQPLGGWVKKQRKEYKMIKNGGKSKILTPERVVLLNDLGFLWDATGWGRGGRKGFG